MVGFVLLLLYLSFLILRGFLSAIIWAAVFAYLFTPLYDKILSKVKKKVIASIMVCTLIVFVILLPLVPLVTIVGTQLVNTYVYVSNEQIINYLPKSIVSDVTLNAYLQQAIEKSTAFIITKISDFIFSIPGMLIDVFLFLFVLFYLFMDGTKFVHQIKILMPVPLSYKEKFLRETKVGVRAILYGVVMAGIVQGIVGTIGLFIFGVPNALFLGVLMTFFSLIPFIGSWLVWLPASVWMVASGNYVQGFGLLIYGAIVVSSVDNIVRSKIIGTRAKLHPAIVMVGLLGGLQIFGLVGLVVGPLILSFLLSSLKLYRERRNTVSQ
tara:strand:+ start:223 stop:1194 length:972 start_codon:yes stop_codon:yes gene_type:complete